MVADAKLTGIGKAALAVEADIALEQNSAVAESCRFLQGVIEQRLTIPLALELRCNTNRPHRQNRDHPAVIRFDDRLHEHILPDQPAILLHDEIQFPDESRIISKHMDHVMLTASRTVHVPERFPDEIFNFSVVFGSF